MIRINRHRVITLATFPNFRAMVVFSDKENIKTKIAITIITNKNPTNMKRVNAIMVYY